MGEPNKSLPAKRSNRLTVDTFGGKVHIAWDPDAAVTPLGQLAFFIDFFKDRRYL